MIISKRLIQICQVTKFNQSHEHRKQHATQSIRNWSQVKTGSCGGTWENDKGERVTSERLLALDQTSLEETKKPQLILEHRGADTFFVFYKLKVLISGFFEHRMVAHCCRFGTNLTSTF